MSSRQPHDIQAQTKRIIFNVYSYFKKLSKDSSQPEVAKYFIQAQKKTSEACGISVSTIKRITSEGSKAPTDSETGPCFTSPRKTYKRIKYATDISDFAKDVLRRTVLEFYDRGEFPTSLKILSKFQEKTGYKGSQTSLQKILKSLNFKFRKCIDGRRFIMEENDIVLMRVQFLSKMVNLRQNNDVRQVVYLNELEFPISKVDRLIIYHAGSSSNGFMKDSQLVFPCKSGSEDHQSQINSIKIKDWLIKILNNLKEPSVIVVDNTWFNWVCSENYPKSKESKINLQKWLHEKGVKFSPLETSQELRERVNQRIPRERRNELNEIALSMEHEIVQLPQYHYQYNPINLVWARVKEKCFEQITTLKVEDIEKSVHDTLNSVNIDEWKICVTLSHKIQDDDYVKEVLRDKFLKSLVKTTNPDDSYESEDQKDNS